MTEMHSTFKPADPFNFNHYIGVHSRGLHLKDFIYMLNLVRFLPDVFTVDSQIIKKYAMADLHNWIKV